jgi:hypothetical protein
MGGVTLAHFLIYNCQCVCALVCIFLPSPWKVSWEELFYTDRWPECYNHLEADGLGLMFWTSFCL